MSVPTGFPNLVQTNPAYSENGGIEIPYLDGNLTLWRIGEKFRRYGVQGDDASFVFINAANSQGPVMAETTVRCLHGTSAPPQYTVYDQYWGRVFQTGPNICFLWVGEKDDYNGTTTTSTWRFGTQLLTPDGMLLNNYDGAYGQHSIVRPSSPLGDAFWFLGQWSSGTPVQAPWFCGIDAYGRPCPPAQTSFAGTTRDTMVYAAVPLGGNVVLLWDESWDTSLGKARREIWYQVVDRQGNTVKSAAALIATLPDSDPSKDEWEINGDSITDQNGRVWISLRRRATLGTTCSYVILDTNGTIWKGPTATPTNTIRYYQFCDREGKVWATENGQCWVFNDDDTSAATAKTGAWIPGQAVLDCAASVQQDGYRIYDRWTNPQMVVYRHADSYMSQMRLYDLNLWGTNAHPSDLAILKDTTQVWSQSGAFNTSAAVDMSAALPMGQTALTLTQNDIHGGQVLVTFDYKADYNAPPIIDSPPTASPSPVNGTSTTLSVSAYDPDNKPQALTYTWSVASGGSVTFSASNGTTTGDVCMATFQAAGSYTLQVAVSDGKDSVAATVDVTVNQTLSTIAIAPDPVTMPTGGTQQFSATAKDQFGNALATQPPFTWSCSGGGSIDANTGAYSAINANASVVVSAVATVGSASASDSADVTVLVLDSVTVSPADVVMPTGGTQQFSAVAKDQFGNALATQPPFTWSCSGGGSIDANTGAYSAIGATANVVVEATATVGSASASGSAYVTVRVLDSVAVSAASYVVSTEAPENTMQFVAVAKDQFGDNLSPQPAFTWSATGAGSIDASGLFTGANAPGTATVTAHATVEPMTKEGSASVTVLVPIHYDPSNPPTFTPSLFLAGQELQFSAVVDQPGATLTWVFGDGTTDTGSVVKHTYNSAGTYRVTVIASAGGFYPAEVSMDVVVRLAWNLWVMKQSVKVGTDGSESWQAQYLFNANRTSALIFDPAKDPLVASLGQIPEINVTPPASMLTGKKPRFTFKSAKGVTPVVSVTVDMSKQTILLNATKQTIPDTVPAELRNNVTLGRDAYELNLFFDNKGKFTANSGYRTVAFVVAAAKVRAKAAGTDSATFSLLLKDPAFQYPGTGGETTVRFRVLNAAGDAVVDKDFTAIVTALSGKFKTSKDTTAPVGKFSYDSLKGKASVTIKNATLTGLLSAVEDHVAVELTIGDKTYSTSVTLFAPTAGSYSTKLPK